MSYSLEFLIDRLYTKFDEKMASVFNKITLPPFDVTFANHKTCITNVGAIAKVLNRNYIEIQQYFEDEMSLKGKISKSGDNDVMIIVRMVNKRQVEMCIDRFIRTYVQCKSCKNVNTEIIKEDRITFILCKICNQKNPIK